MCRSTPRSPGWNSPLPTRCGCRLRSSKGHFTVEGPRIQRGPRQSTTVLHQRFELIKHEIPFLVTSERAVR